MCPQSGKARSWNKALAQGTAPRPHEASFRTAFVTIFPAALIVDDSRIGEDAFVDKIVKARISHDDLERIRNNADTCGLTVSEYIRRAALEKKLAPITDGQAVGELRHVAAMLKHLYPKSSNWTNAEKRKYWDGFEHLLAIAKSIEDRGR